MTRKERKEWRETGRKPEGYCRWFALCEREAVTTVPHPVLGEVPCCEKCAKFARGE